MLQKLGHKSMQNIFAVANTSTHICAIGEFYIQGSIESCVGTYDFHKLGQFTKDMVRVLHYAHNHGIAHGHLTLSNVFLREAGQGTVIADFGLAHMFSNFSAQQLYDADYRDVGLFPPEKITQVAATSSASGVCEDEDEEEVDEMESSSASSCDPRSRQNGGTPKQMRRAEAHDLWALGCMIYQLASGSRGRAPFADTTGHVMGVTEERDALFHRIRTKEPDFSWCTDNNLADLLARLLDKNPRRRGPFLTVLRHPFIRTRVDVSRSLPAIKTDDSPLLQAANKRSASSSKQLQKPFQKGTGFHHQPIGSDDEERVMSDTKSDVGTSATISESPSFTEGSIQELLPIATGCNTKGHQSLAQCFSVASFRKQHSSAFGGFEKTFNAGGTVGALEKSMMPRPRGVLFSVEGFKCSHCGQQIKVASYQCAECPDFRVCRSCQFQQIFVHDPDHELICHAVDTTVDDGMAQSRSRRGTLMIPTSNLTEREATIFSMTGTLPVALDFERSTRGIARHHSMKVGGAVPISRNSSKRFDGEELGSTIIKSPGSPRSPLKECSSAGSLPSASINEEQSTEVKPRPQLMSGEEDENMMLEETPDALIDENLSSLAPDLMLADLQIVEFPFIIVNPPMAHLTILDLANNFLTSIPDDIEFLVNLRRLLLGNNKLTVLPETIGNLTDLETLDVNHNQLTSLPQSLMFCDQLEVLALDYNDFEEIPTLLVDIEVRQVYLAANPRISSWPSADDLQNFPKGITIGLDNEPHLFRDAPTVLAQCPNVHVLWNKIYPDEIIPNLYLGSLRTAQSQEIYQRLHLTHLLTMGRGLEPQAPEGGQHKIVIVDDIEGANIDFAFEEAIVFIEEALSQETGCLVHCFAGMSRSATTVIAYLMMKRGMRLDDAYCLTKKGRPAIYPNGGFFNQLLALDAKLYPGQRELNMPSMERDKKP
jgi:Leucine-rich repeat (LRR) protein/serine/threonine protein kinase